MPAIVISAPDFHFYHCQSANTTMGHDIKTFKEATALLLHIWRDSKAFFLSIELWLLLLVAGATVGGFWLAVLGDGWALACLGFAFGYPLLRVMLHVKRVLAWPFM
jgi:hypothetical protein